jgi:hypothetical protein
VLEDVIGDGLDFAFGVTIGRQAGLVAPQEVSDRDMDGISGRFLLASLIDTELLGLQRSQQLHGHPCRSSRHGANAVERDVGIPGDEYEPLGLGLGDQHPVERVAVMRRKGACLLRMVERHE